MFQQFVGAGNLGKPVEVTYTPGGTAVGKGSIACEDSYKDKSGDWKKSTEWVNFTVFGKQAEFLAEKSDKGSKLLIIGRLKTESWDGKDGKKHYKTGIVASTVKILSEWVESGSSGNRTRNDDQSQEVTDDDIPF